MSTEHACYSRRLEAFQQTTKPIHILLDHLQMDAVLNRTDIQMAEAEASLTDARRQPPTWEMGNGQRGRWGMSNVGDGE